MARSGVVSACLSVAALVLFLAACGDDRDKEVIGSLPCDDCQTDGITGIVLDDDGQPVAGAAIGLVYMLEEFELPGDWDTLKPRTQITFELGETEVVSLVVYDNAGNPVRTLVDETTAEIPDVFFWDALDDDGQMVPVGLYIVRAVFADHSILERVIFFYDYEIEAFLYKPNAVTGSDGSYRIPRDLIPVGAEIPIYDEDGVFLGLHKVLPEIRVVAVIEYLGTLYSRSEFVTLTEDDTRVNADFAFPFAQK